MIDHIHILVSISPKHSVDKKEYSGPIYEQIDEAYQFVLRNIRTGAEFGGLLRRDVYELPIDSIRELIANAVSHRSYLDNGNVQVALYDDRLEVTSPGMLIGGLTIEEMKKGYSRPRNKGIVSALAYMKVVERWGSGIPRLYENCKNAGLREPELSEKAGCFRVNMFRNTELTPVTEENAADFDGLLEEEKEQKKRNRNYRTDGKDMGIDLQRSFYYAVCDDGSVGYFQKKSAVGIGQTGCRRQN